MFVNLGMGKLLGHLKKFFCKAMEEDDNDDVGMQQQPQPQANASAPQGPTTTTTGGPTAAPTGPAPLPPPYVFLFLLISWPTSEIAFLLLERISHKLLLFFCFIFLGRRKRRCKPWPPVLHKARQVLSRQVR